MTHPLTDFLSSVHAFTPEERASIADAFRLHPFSEGEALSGFNQINRNLFFIVQGVLRIVLFNDAGVEITHFFLKENQFCTIQKSFIDEVPAAERIEAASDGAALVIGKQRLLELYKQIPVVKTVIDGVIQRALLDKIALRNRYLGLNAAERYRLFLSLQGDVARLVSLHDVASYLGITQQSLSRIRRGLS